MGRIRLVRPTPELEQDALDFKQAFFRQGERVINGSELLDKTDSYTQWMDTVTQNADSKTVDSNWVLTDTFFAVDESNNRIVGIIDLRHTLNDFLKNFGNSGYSVRPEERNKGYATAMLQELLTVAEKAGLKELHLSVERENVASVRTIVKNGGVYERSFEYEGAVADVYKVVLGL